MWLLVLVTSYSLWTPTGKSALEYSSKESCEAALVVAKEAYSTVNRDSYCISVSEFTEKERKRQEVKRLKKELETK